MCKSVTPLEVTLCPVPLMSCTFNSSPTARGRHSVMGSSASLIRELYSLPDRKEGTEKGTFRLLGASLHHQTMEPLNDLYK